MQRNYITLTLVLLLVVIGAYFIVFEDKGQTQTSEEIPKQIEETPKEPVIEQPQEIEEPKEYKIDILYRQFEPKELKIKQGSTVIWTNKDTKTHKIYHNAPNKEFYSEILNPRDTFSRKFDKEGTYNYG